MRRRFKTPADEVDQTDARRGAALIIYRRSITPGSAFCCDRGGRTGRMTPPSVRFLGRKVYLGAMVILISAMRQGPTPRRVRELSRLFGVDAATIARWQAFWRDHIPQTPFRKLARAPLVAVAVLVALPLSLVDAFLHWREARRSRDRVRPLLPSGVARSGRSAQVAGRPG
jgi:hypothetical protein